MKKIVLSLVLVTLVLSLVGSIALAATDSGQARGARFALVGVIVGKTTSPDTLSIKVCAANQVVASSIGSTITVQFPASVRIRPYGAAPGVLMSFADIQVGQEASVGGMYSLTAQTYTAIRATVGELPIVCEP